MRYSIVAYQAELHERATVEALARLRRSNGSYPPPQDADSSYDSLRAWLLEEPALGRWVAADGRAVAGHVLVTEIHGYLIRHLGLSEAESSSLAEVGKLFVAPEAQGQGIGEELLVKACSEVFAAGRRPALAVLPSSEAAVRLYQRVGLVMAGSFEGVHGSNLVMIGDRSLSFNRSWH